MPPTTTQSVRAVEMFDAGFTQKEIAQDIGVCPITAARWLRASGRVSTGQPHSRKYRALNREFFSTVTPESAYFAGFIAADGCIIGNSVSIGLAPKDEEWLEQFRRVAAIPQPIRTDKQGYVRLYVTCRQWCDDLRHNFNITPRKSLTIRPPRLAGALAWAFVRGYFDGDGTVCRRYSGIQLTSGSRPMLEWIAGVMGSHHTICATGNAWIIGVYGPVGRLAARTMYAGSTTDTRLARKYEAIRAKDQVRATT